MRFLNQTEIICGCDNIAVAEIFSLFRYMEYRKAEKIKKTYKYEKVAELKPDSDYVEPSYKTLGNGSR